MKTKNPSEKFVASFLTAIFCSAVLTQAQTVSTPVVGFQNRQINSGSLAVLSAPFTDAVVTATVLGGTTNSVTLNQTGLGTLFNSTDPIYLEVLSGSNEGERYDVSLTGITSATDTLTINTGSANNTSSFSGSALVNAQVAVRKHTTLNTLKSSFSPALKTGSSATVADAVSVFTSGAWTPYYVDSTGNWKRSGSLSTFNNLVIPPGSAVMFKRNDTSATTFTVTGQVRATKFAKNYKTGLSVYAPGFPVAYSPNTMGANAAGGWQTGDAIYVLSGSAFVIYTYNGTNWRRSGQLTNYDNSLLLTSDSGILVRKATASNVSEVSPIN